MVINELYYDWYHRLDVQYEVIQFLKFRETAFITKDKDMQPQSSRMHKIHSVQHLRINMEAVPYRLHHPYNLYHSVARYKDGIPHQTLNFCDKSRSEINTAWRGGSHIHNIYTYDFIIDIDAPTHNDMELAKQSAIRLHKFYLYHGVPHEIRFTGMGFHFIVPDSGTWTEDYNPNTLTNVYQQFVQLARLLYTHISEMIDLKIYDSRRVIKCPYSLSVYGDEAFVCWPFYTTEELLAFDYRSMKIQNAKDFSQIIKKRGTYVFNRGNNPDFILDSKWQHESLRAKDI